MSEGGYNSNYFYSSNFDYEAYRRELEQRRLAQLRYVQEEQAKVDSLAHDPKAQLAAQRNRYKCRDKFVMLKDIIPWSEYIHFLVETPSHTTVPSPPPQSHSQSSGWSSYYRPRDEPPPITPEDTLARYDPDPSLNNKISLLQGDITTLEIDSIVNAANSSLLGGGGIDGAIHAAAGPLLENECRGLNGCETGYTKMTRGYALPAKHVLHTVGPIGSGDEKLRSCYVTTLNLIKEHHLRTVAFCCIGTGIFGFPPVRAAHIAMSTIREWLMKDGNAASIDRFIFCVFGNDQKEVYEKILPAYFPIEGFPKHRLVKVASVAAQEKKGSEEGTGEDREQRTDAKDGGENAESKTACAAAGLPRNDEADENPKKD